MMVCGQPVSTRIASVSEERLKELARQTLLHRMQEISEEFHYASWLSGIEYYLWDAVVGGGPRGYPDRVVKELSQLSMECEGWFAWQDFRAVFVPIDQWLARFSQWQDNPSPNPFKED